MNNENDISRFKDIIEKKFETIVDENGRAMKSNIDRVCLLRDVSSFIHHDNVDIDFTLLNKIRLYINNHEVTTIYLADIYEGFKDELNKKSNIDNKYFLHGIIRYFYNDEYTFTRDSLSRTKDRLNGSEILKNYLREKNKVLTKEEIRKYLKGWTDIMFSINAKLNNDILIWDRSHYVISDILDIRKEDIKVLDSAI